MNWKLHRLGDFFSIKHGFAFESRNFSSFGKYIVVTPGNFSEEGGFRNNSSSDRYYNGDFNIEYILRKDDLLVVMTEQKAGLLGSPALVPEAERYLHNQRLGLVTDLREDRLDRNYLYHLFNYSDIRKQISTSAGGTKVRHTSPTKILNVTFMRPPFGEQKEIAAILSTVDRAIELTERLIAIKQGRKKALMQRLLTSKVRFPEFDGKAWEWVELGKLTKPIKRPVIWDDQQLYNLASIRRHSKGLFFREPAFGHQIKVKKLFKIEKDDFLISNIQAAYGAMAIVPKKFHESFISDQYTILISADPKNFDIGYLGFISESSWFRHQILMACNGFFAERLRLLFSVDELLKRKVFVPPTIEEQRRIVEVLTLANDEIRASTRKLKWLKRQKKGLMQQLFTGKVRVNNVDLPPGM